ncbi:3-hydroxyacyl-ACP dehydratase FabZ [Marinicella sp. S1101]|uniref:3-hydroxyacyl-ACP dehydratase FabZ n=1 Tax=Marinicella marina TaxID=2996016 RepID=UPI002260F964|nr:3-hydroxyacyl-ACP dehydratase FabZ [Marinicella marina]MCX7554815.1 3-hydroxyacyl-ACP dehydratase FabZ [Marinicella marina]MDJ1140952.1 3-hydroxyacyl-ACP dehydratase FabZ [Marinicella marina]
MTEDNKTIGVEQIMQLIPHRYPFLLVDKVIDYEPGEWIKAIKNVTFNEPQFEGHFPGHPVMPGVMLVEAMAQAAGVLTQLSRDGSANDALFYLVKVDNAKFTQIVTPGDQLVFECQIKKVIRNMTQYQCKATVDGKVVAKADILCAEKSK